MAAYFAGGFKQFYGVLWKSIIRPPRAVYEDHDLGEREFVLKSDRRHYVRTDFEVMNSRHQVLKCSHYEPAPNERGMERLPCVIFLHGNSSCQEEASCLIPFLLPLNITVVGFDFSGSGNSDGKWVTLGWLEQYDLACVLEYLRDYRRISTVALWGRSMGAVTALLHAKADPTIMGIVADSPFADLRRLAAELSDSFVPVPLPSFVVQATIGALRNTIRSKCGFDIDNMNIKGKASRCTSPIVFVTGKSDDFIRHHHAEELFEVYKAPKWLIKVNGDHNSPRSERVMLTLAVFLYNTLQCETLLKAGRLPERNMRYWNCLRERANSLTFFPCTDWEKMQEKPRITETSVFDHSDDYEDDIDEGSGQGSGQGSGSWLWQQSQED